MSTPDWSRQWPLPSPQEVQDKLIEGRTLTAADRIALFRDGHLVVPTDQAALDRALRLAAQGAFVQGTHGQRRPVFEWQTHRQTNRADPWPVKAGDPWPTWEGEDWEAFAHRAHVALWLDQGANPWLPWGQDRHGPWGLPEILIAAGDVGLWRRVMAHPATPPPADLAKRRLGPPAGSTGQPHLPWLHAAAGLADPTLMNDLLKQGRNPNARDDQANTPLFYAHDAQAMTRLLDHGADPDAVNAKQDSVRSYWARVSRSFKETLAPVLDAYSSPAASQPTNGLTDSELQEVFGQGARGLWPEVKAKMDQVGPAWNQWRQGVTLKNGQVRDASWLGYCALHLMSPKDNPRGGISHAWHHGACHVLDAAQKTLDEATPDSVNHETLPGLSDGLLWAMLVRRIGYLQPEFKPGWDDADRRDTLNALERRRRALRDEWEDKASQGGSRVQALTQQLAGMRANLNTWATPAFWRDEITAVVRQLIGDKHQYDSLLTDSCRRFREGGGYRDDPSPADQAALRQQWGETWTTLAQLMLGDKTLRERLFEPVLYAAIDRVGLPGKGPMSATLFPVTSQSAVVSALWLHIAENKDDYGIQTSRENLFDGAWARWQAAGVTVDPQALGARGVALLKDQLPKEFATLEAPARPRRRAP